jgi:hypothetical protein
LANDRAERFVGGLSNLTQRLRKGSKSVDP